MIDFNTNLPRKLLISVCMLVLYSMNSAPPAMAGASSLPEQKTQEILKQFSLQDCEYKTAKKWEKYLTEHTWFDDEIHLKAIMETGLKFASSLLILEDCMKEMEHRKDQSDSGWIQDFHKEFDTSYTMKNMDSIRFIITSLSARNEMNYCKEQKKEALYQEILYRQTLEDYLQLLQDFAATLDTKEREKIEARLKAADTFLQGPPYPLKVLLSPHRQMLFPIALTSRKDLDPRLVEFFTQNAFFRKPFNPLKAVDDLSSGLVSPE
jgi:hypothetical protein